MLPANMSEVDRKKVEEYQERMRADCRCTQCIFPWYDGLCECDKNGPEQDEIANLVYKYL